MGNDGVGRYQDPLLGTDQAYIERFYPMSPAMIENASSSVTPINKPRAVNE
jgi:hypothetical protein